MTTTATPIMSCPSWCRPERAHDEFGEYEDGEFAGADARLHDRILGRLSPRPHQDVDVALSSYDVIRCDDQGVSAVRTAPFVRLTIDTVDALASIDLSLVQFRDLVDVLSSAIKEVETLAR